MQPRKLRDLHDDWVTEHDVYIVSDSDDIIIYDNSTRQPICAVEIYKGKLRVLAWPDESDEPTVVTIGERGRR